MKLSLNWLKDYVDPKLSTDDLVHRLTMAGLEVEGRHSTGKDIVLELEITPNRPDCLNVLGLAREIAAMTGKALKLPKVKTHKPTKNKIPITIADKKDCSRYTATLIEGVSIAPSPAKMSQCLSVIGLRPINSVVDITNFVLMETGQPLHAFDYDKIAGGKIIVRRAKAGEKIVTLDGVERLLDPSILVIADVQKPVAIAGLMGGKATEVTSATKNILLESASFDMGLVRKASRTLGLKSDSSYRFERGIDFDGVRLGADRATDLICAIAGGKVIRRTDNIKNRPLSRKPIMLGATDVEELLGTAVALPKVRQFLSGLGFAVSSAAKKGLKVVPPSWRGDNKANVDVVEEVARMVGYDRLSEGLPVVKAVNIRVDARPRAIKETVAQALVAQGFCEALTYSLISKEALERSGLKELPGLMLRNFLSREHSMLRPSMLPSLLEVVQTNLHRTQKDLRLFEVGKIYSSDGEKSTLALIMTGRRGQDWWHHQKDNAVNFYDLKGVLQRLLCHLGVPASWQASTCPALDSSASADIILNGHSIGYAGKISTEVLARWDIKAQGVYFAQIDLGAIFALPAAEVKYHPVSTFPAIVRDVSVAIKADLPYARIKEVCLSSAGALLKSVQLIEEYTGDKVPAGTRALVFSLTYQSDQCTLREEEVNALHQNVLKALSKQTDAVLR